MKKMRMKRNMTMMIIIKNNKDITIDTQNKMCWNKKITKCKNNGHYFLLT